ncbi:aldo/keto reductase [Mycolicibacterium nivoides]|uniref:aldo/keto reductase n=1 Tax=Mycolicibacterium nivoides TaxID=2487344 RepID=UPI0008D0CE8A|nr:aldo/keto reductase [Mycolicibacterium nivoides]SEQ30681.1 Predicted oxidoreductase [Mycobacterium sp. 88mf]SFF44171.1 Predicted oxidoreductase [Mycobacterium sp. 455mf]
MSDLERRRLGDNGPQVTVLGFGAMELRGEPHRNPRPLDESVAAEVLNTVLDEGINFIDTSVDYALSEERIGRHIGARRDEYFLASKAGCPLDFQPDAPPGPLPHDYSPANIRAGVEQSLRRLRTDRLDLVQLHISPSLQVLRRDGAVETLTELREEGKILSFGVSSTLPEIDDHLQIDEFSAFQVPFSALERDLETRIQIAGDRGFGIIVRGGVAQAGKREKTTVDGRPVTWADTGLDELRDQDSQQGFLLRYAITTPGVTTVIAGTADPDHVRQNAVAARRGPLPADVYAEARRRLDDAGITTAVIPADSPV